MHFPEQSSVYVSGMLFRISAHQQHAVIAKDPDHPFGLSYFPREQVDEIVRVQGEQHRQHAIALPDRLRHRDEGRRRIIDRPALNRPTADEIAPDPGQTDTQQFLPPCNERQKTRGFDRQIEVVRIGTRNNPAIGVDKGHRAQIRSAGKRCTKPCGSTTGFGQFKNTGDCVRRNQPDDMKILGDQILETARMQGRHFQPRCNAVGA